MRTQRVFLLLFALLWLSKVAPAQRTANQPIEWIVRETSGNDQWGYVAPDGVVITYSRSMDGQTWQLLVTNLDGQSPRPFLIAPPAPSLTRGAWSRRHRRLAFTGSSSGDVGAAVYVADATGRNVKRVPAQGVSAQVMYPSWMPDGRSVVVVDYGAPGGSALYRIDIESGRSNALTNPKEFLVGMPSVSPDGQLVAFAGQPNGGATYDQTKNQIWILPLGGRPYQVSAGQGRQPDWSPDGRWLAFTSNRGDSTGRHAVFVVDRTGRNLIQLTDYFSNAQHPVWSPDGTWLLFSAEATDRSGVFGLARITVPKLPK
jgi:Tol biopolymer transport system component